MGLKINYSQVTNSTDAYNKARSVITPEYIEKFQVKTDLKYDDATKKVIAKGSGFTLVLSFLEDHCDLDIDLSFLLKPLKSKITEKIEAQIKRNL
jgi:predicted nucleic acid-binding protein